MTIEIETYRYLLSALIQVFGALIAIDAIFLIVRYETLIHKLSPTIYRLGIFIYTSKKYTRIRNVIMSRDDREDIEIQARLLETLNPSIIQKEIVEIEQKLTEDIKSVEKNLEVPNIPPQSELLERRQKEKQVFMAQKDAYNLIRGQLDRMPQSVVKMMGFPAAIALILSLELSVADTIYSPKLCFWLAIFSVCLAAFGFKQLICWAISLIKD